MRIIAVSTDTGEVFAGKDLVTGYANVPQRMGGVVLSPPPSTTSKKPQRRRNVGGHDPERPGGLLNGRPA